MIFETHAHYEDKKFDEDRETLLQSLPENGIGTVVNVSSSLETIEQIIELTKKYPFIYGAVGIHPEECAQLDENSFSYVRKMAQTDKVLAIGEIGLDYYWDEPAREIQKRWFEEQIELARELALPMIIHSRDAAADTQSILKSHKAEEIGGVIHCFSYGREMAAEFLKMNFYLGIGGIVTFKNARKLKEVVEYAPIERILLETDCPYMAPIPNRGSRNSSLNLVYVAKEIANIKGLDYDKVIEITERNARTMYHMRLTENNE